MGKFADAFRSGLDAKEQRENAETEVRHVLAEAAADLGGLFGEGFSLTLRRQTKLVEGIQTEIKKAMGIVPKKYEVEVWVVRGEHGTDTSPSLAEIEFAEAGYPVEVRWPDRLTYGEDIEGFRRAVVELLASRQAATHLSTLLPEPDNEDEGPA